MSDIEKLANRYANEMAELKRRIDVLDARLRSAKRRSMPGITAAAERAAALKAELRSAIQQARDEFERPRTRILHGVKVGFRKGKDTLQIDDAEKTVARINKLFPDQADILIKTEHKPVKQALQRLSTDDQKRVGVYLEPATDQVVVELMDSEIEKVVDVLLKGDDEEDA